MSSRRAQIRRERRSARKTERASVRERASNENLLEAIRRLPLGSGGSWSATDLDPTSPAVIARLLKYIRATTVVKPVDRVLRTHPGKRSPIPTETLVLGMLIQNWRRCSYRRSDMIRLLGDLPDDLAQRLGIRDQDGVMLGKATFYKQIKRLEDLLRDAPRDAGMPWLEDQMILHSVPDRVRSSVRTVSLDETAFGSWFVTADYQQQTEIDTTAARIYQQRHPDDPVPAMSSDVMRAICAEMGVLIGPDGRIIRTPFDRDVRSGYKTPTNKNPSEMFIGFGSTSVTAGPDIVKRRYDHVTFGPRVPIWCLSITTTPAGKNPGPIGTDLLQRCHATCPNLTDILVDQAYSQKPAFNQGLRKALLNVHQNYPRPATERVKTRTFAQRGNRAEIVMCNAGWMLHKWTPEHLRTIPPDLSQTDRERHLTARLRWMWRAHAYNDDGSIRFACPFCTGHLTNNALTDRKNRKTKPGALVAPIPPGQTSCCNGTFVASPEQLNDFQQPLWGTVAHTTLMGKRNAVEGTFGVLKNKGAFKPETCRAAGLVPHAMSALMAAVVHNLQTGIEEEYRGQMEHSAKKTARQAATERRRRDNQEPTGSRSQPHQTVKDTDIDENTHHIGSPPSATKARASRSPP